MATLGLIPEAIHKYPQVSILNFAAFSILHKQLWQNLWHCEISNLRSSDNCGILMFVAKFAA